MICLDIIIDMIGSFITLWWTK